MQNPTRYRTMPMPPETGGFVSGLGDVFLGGLDSYLKIREREKMAEITGEAQHYNNTATEWRTNPNARPQQTSTPRQESGADSEQWINGVDNAVVVLGGAGALALLLILTK